MFFNYPFLSDVTLFDSSPLTLSFLLGALLIIIAIVGGGFELKEVKIPAVGGLPRGIAGVAGVFLICFALWPAAWRTQSTPAGSTGTDGDKPAVPSQGAGQGGSPGGSGASGAAAALGVGAGASVGSGEQGSDGQSPFFMNRLVTQSDVANLSAQQIDIMRNEIYARHGRRFIRPDLQQYFEGFSWYHPMYAADAFPNSVLTQVQQRNIIFLQAQQGH